MMIQIQTMRKAFKVSDIVHFQRVFFLSSHNRNFFSAELSGMITLHVLHVCNYLILLIQQLLTKLKICMYMYVYCEVR